MRSALALVACVWPLLSASASSLNGGGWDIHILERTHRPNPTRGPAELLTVHFANGRSYEVPLHRAKPIATLQGEANAALLLVSGADCTECDEGNTLRFFVLGKAELFGSGQRHLYPGTKRDYLSEQLVSKTRVFFGRCLSDDQDVVVWIHRYLGQDGNWHDGQGIARLKETGESFQRIAPGRNLLRRLNARISLGKCTELPGIDGTTEP